MFESKGVGMLEQSSLFSDVSSTTHTGMEKTVVMERCGSHASGDNGKQFLKRFSDAYVKLLVRFLVCSRPRTSKFDAVSTL